MVYPSPAKHESNSEAVTSNYSQLREAIVRLSQGQLREAIVRQSSKAQLWEAIVRQSQAIKGSNSEGSHKQSSTV